MGQLLRAMMYDRDSEDAVPALSIGGTPLTWTPLDDGVMGGKSKTILSAPVTTSNDSTSSSNDTKTLQFEGTIDTEANIGWASARASLPPEGLPENTKALRITFVGDGKTYKVVLMDSNHEASKDSSPLWEADLPTTASVKKETKTLLLQDFTPSHMARQLTAEEKKKYPFNPTKLSKMGFMLSSHLSNGTQNPIETYGQGVFQFALNVQDVAIVPGD